LYLVGGYIRDVLLAKCDHQAPKDFDYAVSGGSGFSFAQALALELQGHFVPLDQENDTARVVVEDGTTFDFAGCVGGNIEADIWRRDFSINALFWDPNHPEIIVDIVGAAADLKKGVVRALSETVLVDDPLRMLRAYRFAAKLNFQIDKATTSWIAKHHMQLAQVASERVNYEFFTAMAAPQMGSHLLDMAQSGLLETIFPELTATRSVTSNTFHHLALFEHSLETVLQAEKVFAQYRQWSLTDELSHQVTRFAATKVACLLHDIGKPKTWVITPEGKHTFIGHERLGEEMVADIAERQKWSRPVERFIAHLVKWHLRPGQLFHQTLPTQKAIYRFYRQAGSDVPELILLALADLGATQGPAMQGSKSEILHDQLFELFKGFDVYIKESEKIPKLLDGNDVMQLLKIKPGQEVGEILLALSEAQECKEVSNRAEAENFVLELAKKTKRNN